jgi:hypothetical protein
MAADSRMYPVGRSSPESRPVRGADGVPTFVEFGVTKTQRTRATAAQVNAGLVLLPALPGVKWRLIDCAMIAIGGNAATATSVDLLATQAGSAVRPVVNVIAGLTRSAVLRMGATNSAVLADGASTAVLDANTSVSVVKQSGGSNLATATHIDVILTYTAEKAS